MSNTSLSRRVGVLLAAVAVSVGGHVSVEAAPAAAKISCGSMNIATPTYNGDEKVTIPYSKVTAAGVTCAVAVKTVLPGWYYKASPPGPSTPATSVYQGWSIVVTRFPGNIFHGVATRGSAVITFRCPGPA